MKNVPISKRILDLLSKEGTQTLDQMYGALSRYVDANRAMQAFNTQQKYDLKRNKVTGRREQDKIGRGRRALISRAVRGLKKTGRIVRVAEATYTLAKPKLKLVG